MKTITIVSLIWGGFMFGKVVDVHYADVESPYAQATEETANVGTSTNVLGSGFRSADDIRTKLH